MKTEFIVSPIAQVHNDRLEIKDDNWGEVISTIKMLPPYTEESILGINQFSHLQIVFVFDQVDPAKIKTAAARPRSNPDWPMVGIFAQRKKSRPNLIGTTVVKLLKLEGDSFQVKGLDAINGTPILDIKPIMQEFLPKEEVNQPDWSKELMKNYWQIEPD